MISMIVAHDINKGIGVNNKLPWSIKEEMEHFKLLTMGKAVIMGRNTFESLGGKTLPHRTNIIVTSRGNEYQWEIRQKYNAPAFVFTTLEEAIEFAKNINNEVMIIGGSRMYDAAKDIVSRVYATEILQKFECDKFFLYPNRMREIYQSPIHNYLDRNSGNHVELVYKIFSK